MPVGRTLADERRKRGLSVADIERATRIRHGVIAALEECKWSVMPATPYVKGYIQNYAQALGQDPAPFLEEYAADMRTFDTEKAPHPALGRIPGRTIVPQGLEVHAIPRRVWLTIAVGVVAVLLIVWVVSSLLSREDAPTPLAPEPTATVGATAMVDGSASTTGSPSPGAAEGDTTNEGDVAFTMTITVKDGESSWLKVTVDSEVVWEDILPGGIPREWAVSRDASVRIGNPDVVTIERDGHAVEIPLSPGVADVTLSAEE